MYIYSSDCVLLLLAMALRDAIVVLASLFAVVMSHSCPNTPAVSTELAHALPSTRVCEEVRTAHTCTYMHAHGWCAGVCCNSENDKQLLLKPSRSLVQPDGVDYPLVLSIPTGCERSQCSFYVAIRVSDEDQEFLDFKMQGRASGYIAIGFGKQKSRMVG